MKTIQRVELPDSFQELTRSTTGYRTRISKVTITLCKSQDQHKTPRVTLAIPASVVNELRWLKGDAVAVAVSINTRRVFVYRVEPGYSNGYALQFGGKQTTNTTARFVFPVKDEPSRLLMPNGRTIEAEPEIVDGKLAFSVK